MGIKKIDVPMTSLYNCIFIFISLYVYGIGADSIAGELLENGGPNLLDALHEVIQQAWTGETLPRSWTEGVLCPVYKKGDKLDWIWSAQSCSTLFSTLFLS
jgi:hypothetical protein